MTPMPSDFWQMVARELAREIVQRMPAPSVATWAPGDSGFTVQPHTVAPLRMECSTVTAFPDARLTA